MTTPRHPGSLLKELDLDKKQFLDLVDLAAELKRDQARQGAERPAADRQEHRAGLREELHPHPLRVRGRRRTTRARTSPISGPRDRTSAGRSRSRDTARVLGRMYDGIEFRGFAQDTVEELADVRRRAGLERADRPVAPDPDARRHPDHDASTTRAVERDRALLHSATAATTSPARCWSPARCSAWTSASPRRASLQPPADVVAAAPSAGRGPAAARIARHRRRRDAAVARRRLRLHRRVGQHGRVRRRVGDAGAAAAALPGDRRRCWRDRHGRTPGSCTACPSMHDSATELGAPAATTSSGSTAPRSTDEVFESPALDRLRPGREPDAHHQGGPRRGAGGLS